MLRTDMAAVELFEAGFFIKLLENLVRTLGCGSNGATEPAVTKRFDTSVTGNRMLPERGV